ncbi:hypothetical protein BJY01DRAFT_88410 [Aspergillus pseudoustus]|uniref:Uncharacterized protein n=1 Tax=Aspergillus pseudoustus TaxID=1810923 RepID=A0ABR4J249_9EURO
MCRYEDMWECRTERMQPRTKGIHAFFREWQLQERQKKTRLVRLEKQVVSWQVKKIGFDGESRNAEKKIGKSKK